MPENNSNTGSQGSTGGQKPTLSWSQPAAKSATPAAAKPAVVATPVKPATTHASASKNEPQSSMGTYVTIFVAGVIIGALIGWGITSGKSSTTTSTTATSTSETANTNGSAAAANGVDLSNAPVGSSASLTLSDAQQAGFAVGISKIRVAAPTWLVVYEDRAGTPGNAIGAGLFFPGVTSGTIQLLRATLPGQSYYVGQSLDDGDKIFSLSTDMPIRDSKGNPLFTQFTAQ